MTPSELPDNTYYRSYLKKAGIHFHYNIVDSTVKKGFSATFCTVVLLVAVLSLFGHGSGLISHFYLSVCLILCFAYILIYLLRYLFFWRKRRSLRKNELPILAEAYAVVLLDRETFWPWLNKADLKRAVLFKESGTMQPRFFLGAASSKKNGITFMPDLKARVFTDKKNPRFYSVDDETAVQTVSEKRTVLGRIGNMQNVQTKVEPCDQKR